MNKDTNLKYQRVFLMLLMILFFFLSFAFLLASKKGFGESSNSWANSDTLASSMFRSKATIRQRQLDQDVEKLSERLEYMVWPYEREHLSRELVQLLRSQINTSPLDTQLWHKLSLVEVDAKVPMNDRVWTALINGRLSAWHTEQRILANRICVTDYEVLVQLLPSYCQLQFEQFPESYRPSLIAQIMGVKIDYLKWVLSKEFELEQVQRDSVQSNEKEGRQ